MKRQSRYIYRVILDNVLLVLAYYLAGHFSMLFLSTLSFNAAVIWPSAGIALAAVVLKGYRVLPAVFIADFIIAVEVFGFNGYIPFIFSLIVGFQALLAAWIGVELIDRVIGLRNPLIDNRSILYFFLLGGPVALLLPSALILYIEYYFGIVERTDLYYSFFIWWSGGVIGVAIFSPIVLILCNRQHHGSRAVSVVVPLIILFGVVVWFFNLTKASEEERLVYTFGQQVNAIHNKTEIKLDDLLKELDTLKFYMESEDHLNQVKFSKIGKHRRRQSPEISAFAWVPLVIDDHDSGPTYMLGLHGRKSALLSEEKPPYKQIKYSFPIHYIEPLDTFQTIIGLNLGSYLQWNKKIENTRKTDKPKLISPMTLLLDDGKKIMSAILLPVFYDDLVNKSATGRLKGYVVLFLPLQSMIQTFVSQAKDQKINLTILGLGAEMGNITGSVEKNGYFFESLKRSQYFGEEISFRYSPDSDFVSNHRSLSISWMLLIGLGGTGLFGFSLLSVTAQTIQTQRLIKRRTEDLNSERQFLKTLINSIQEGIIACDKKGELTIFNSAAENIYGKSLGIIEPEKWGEYFELQSMGGETLFGKGDSPMMLLLNAPPVRDYECSVLSTGAPLRIIKANNVQVKNNKNEVIGAVVSFQDITRQKQTINELNKLSWAVEYCPSAIMITDFEGKIEYVNTKFTDVTGFSPDDSIGNTPGILSSGKTPKEKYKLLWDTLLSGKEWRGNFYNKKKNGDFYWSREIVAPILNELQQITHFVSIQEDITREKQVVDTLSHQASHDELTGLLNRRECESRLRKIIISAKLQNSKHVFCYLDLDNFKIVNDTCGHLAGDHLLREVCDLFKGLLRGRDTLARLGGDEFGIIMEHCTLPQALALAEKICSFVEFYDFIWEGRQFNIGVSIGLTDINIDSPGFTQILSQADEACYMAKKSGRRQACIFGQSL